MSNDLWLHALKVLDGFRTTAGPAEKTHESIQKLYEFQDQTGILSEHKRLYFKESLKQEDVKVLYFELVKMLLDQDKRFDGTRDVDKIQGFQQLTNRLLVNLNDKYLDNMTNINKKLESLEEQLVQTQEQLGNSQEDYKRLENEVADNRTRISTLEQENIDYWKKVNDLEEDLRNRNDADIVENMIQDSFIKLQNDTLDTLSKRIDTNENHIKLMETDLDSRLNALEKADDYLQNALKENITRTEKNENDVINMNGFVTESKDDFDRFKEDQDMVNEKVQGKLNTLTDESKEVQEEQEKLKEQLKQMEIFSDEKVDVINGFVLKIESFENKIGQLEEDNEDMLKKMDKNEETVKDHDDKLDNLGYEWKKAISDTNDNLEKLDKNTEDQFGKIGDRLDNLQNDVNDNTEDVKAANAQLKQRTEDQMRLDMDFEDMKKDIGLMKAVQTNLKEFDETVKDNIDDHHVRLVNLEEANAMQQTQARFVENLNQSFQIEQETLRQNAEKDKELIEEKFNSDLEKVKADIVHEFTAKTMDVDKELNDLKGKLDLEVQEKVNEALVKINELDNDFANEISNLNNKSRDLEENVDAIKVATDQLKTKLVDMTREKEMLVDEVDHVQNDNKKMLEKFDDKLQEVQELAKDQVAKFNVDLLTKIEDANKIIQSHSEDIIELKDKNEEIDDIIKRHPDQILELESKVDAEIKDADEKLRESIKHEMDNLTSKVDDKLEQVDKESQVNAGHVENLREVNNQLLERIKINVQGDIDSNKDKISDLEHDLEELLANVNDLKANDIKDLVDAKDGIEKKIQELEDHSKTLDDDLKSEKEHLIMIMKETKENNEKIVNQLVMVQQTQEDNHDIEMLKATIDQLEDKYMKAEQDRELLSNEMRIMETKQEQNLDDLDQRRTSDAQFTTGQLTKLETTMLTNNQDMWNVVLPIYGALRGYSVVLYSKDMGKANEHLSICKGVYRSIDYFGGRPIYKQDGGEVFLYYIKTEKSWLIGPQDPRKEDAYIDNYAWMRNKIEYSSSEGDSESSASGSATSSSSDSDASMGSSSSSTKKKKKVVQKKDKLDLDIRTPDQLTTPWQYRLRSTGFDQDHEQDTIWNDDESLRVEALKEVDRLSKVIRRIRAEQPRKID